ncbi:hypothetical protein [Nitrobacter vulgaris]|nr:hypothetical protein [Nitrobacter vulgaris]
MNRLIRRLDAADFATANDKREFSKTALDILKNIVLLGALKYAANKTAATGIEVLYWVGCALFFMHLTSFLLPWRVRILELLWRNNSIAHGIDVVINLLCIFIFQALIWYFIYDTSGKLAASH